MNLSLMWGGKKILAHQHTKLVHSGSPMTSDYGIRAAKQCDRTKTTGSGFFPAYNR